MRIAGSADDFAQKMSHASRPPRPPGDGRERAGDGWDPRGDGASRERRTMEEVHICMHIQKRASATRTHIERGRASRHTSAHTGALAIFLDARATFLAHVPKGGRKKHKAKAR